MNLSFWESTTFDRHYDVIIIGAGITGNSTAYHVREHSPDARIVLLERGFYPSGASTKNAGFACFGSISEILDDLKRSDESTVKDRIERRYKGFQLLSSIIGRDQLEYVDDGGFELFQTDDRQQADLHKACVDAIPEMNQWFKEITGTADVFSELTLNGIPAIKSTIEGGLNPAAMMKRWEEINRERGCEYRFNTEVREVNEQSVILQNGMELTADQIVITTNAFTSNLITDPAYTKSLPKISPGRGYVFVASEFPSIPWNGIFHYDEGYVYARNIGNRWLIGGARNLAFEEETTTEFGINQQLKTHLIQLTNELFNLPVTKETIDYEWSGIMGFTPDKHPICQRINPTTILAAGLSGMGVAIGSQLGKEVAEEVKSG